MNLRQWPGEAAGRRSLRMMITAARWEPIVTVTVDSTKNVCLENVRTSRAGSPSPIHRALSPTSTIQPEPWFGLTTNF